MQLLRIGQKSRNFLTNMNTEDKIGEHFLKHMQRQTLEYKQDWRNFSFF